MPIIGVDWQEVKSRLADTTALFALTVRQSAILLSISDQLTWEATWRNNDYDFEDWDTLQKEVADLQAQLAMPVDLSTLIGHVDEIEDLLRMLQSTNDGCCDGHDWTGGDGYTDEIIEDSSNGVPDHLVDSGWATDDDDWEGFEEYMCHVAHVLVNNMGHKVVQLLDVFDDAGTLVIGVGALAGLIALVMGSAATLLVAGILLAAGSATRLWDKLLQGGADVIPDFEEVEAARDALVCAWMDSANDGIDDRITALHDSIDTEFSVVEAEILKLLMPVEWIKAIYTGKWSDGTETIDISQRMVDAGIGPGTYECECSPDIGQYQTDLETIAGGSYDWLVPNTTQGTNVAWGNPDWGSRTRYDEGRWRVSTSQLRLEVGLGSGDPADTVTIKRITFHYKMDNVLLGKMKVRFDIGGSDVTVEFDNSLTWVEVDYTLPTPELVAYNAWAVDWQPAYTGSGGYLYIDNVLVDFDAPV